MKHYSARQIRFDATSIAALAGLGAAACLGITLAATSQDQLTAFVTYYRDHLRQPLFTGLLTVATFMFSLKAFIIVTMKNNVYGTAEYEKEWQRAKTLSPTLKRYAALERFALLLFISIFLSLSGAVLQFTIGLLEWRYAPLVCLAAAEWAVTMIFISLFHMHENLRSWFRYLDDGKS